MEKNDWVNKLQEKAYELRNSTLEMCVKAGTGHVTSSFSSAEILTSLYYGNILNHDPKNPGWKDRDRFLLSKGQASPILYATLADRGYFPKSWLETFNKKGGKFGVHLQRDVPGAEITSGSLGIGLALGAGKALAAKMNENNYLTFVLMGDGECYEGSIWESAMFASHNKLNNLIGIVDRNYLCVTNFTEDLIKLEPLEKKWEAFGWDVKRVDGHNIGQITDSLQNIRSHRSYKPLVIIADTVKGKGISSMENEIFCHGIAPKGEEAKEALEELKKYKK